MGANGMVADGRQASSDWRMVSFLPTVAWCRRKVALAVARFRHRSIFYRLELIPTCPRSFAGGNGGAISSAAPACARVLSQHFSSTTTQRPRSLSREGLGRLMAGGSGGGKSVCCNKPGQLPARRCQHDEDDGLLSSGQGIDRR